VLAIVRFTAFVLGPAVALLLASPARIAGTYAMLGKPRGLGDLIFIVLLISPFYMALIAAPVIPVLSL